MVTISLLIDGSMDVVDDGEGTAIGRAHRDASGIQVEIESALKRGQDVRLEVEINEKGERVTLAPV